MARPRTRRRERRSVPQGRAYIYSTFNNTLVSITDPQGNVIASASAGMVGFKGSRKGTAFAAQRAGEDANQLRNLLPPGSGSNNVAGLEVLQVVARDSTGAADESGDANCRDDQLLRVGAVID